MEHVVLVDGQAMQLSKLDALAAQRESSRKARQTARSQVTERREGRGAEVWMLRAECLHACLLVGGVRSKGREGVKTAKPCACH